MRDLGRTCADACTRRQAARGATVLGAVVLKAVLAWVEDAGKAPFMIAKTIVTNLARLSVKVLHSESLQKISSLAPIGFGDLGQPPETCNLLHLNYGLIHSFIHSF